jgi:hypothetical protein
MNRFNINNYDALKNILRFNPIENLESLHNARIINVRSGFVSDQEVQADDLQNTIYFIFCNYEQIPPEKRDIYSLLNGEKRCFTFIWDGKILVFYIYLSKSLRMYLSCESIYNLNIITYYLDLHINNRIHDDETYKIKHSIIQRIKNFMCAKITDDYKSM